MPAILSGGPGLHGLVETERSRCISNEYLAVSTAVIFVIALSAIDVAAETRQLNFTGFDEVSVGGGMQVSIAQGAMYRVGGSKVQKGL